MANDLTTQTTTNTAEEKVEFIDRSELLLSQMNFIAINNKSFINYRK